jgi:hypothetical protein
MTDETDGQHPVVQTIDGFDEIQARQQTIHCWTVTSVRNDSQTVHQVNLYEQTCTCEDYEYADEDNYACDHILLANHRASRKMDVGEALQFDLIERTKELETHVQTIEQRSLDIAATATQSDPEPADDDTDDGGSSSGNALAGFDDLSEGPEALQTLIENEFGSDPPVVCKEIDDGWEIKPHLKEMSDSMLDDFDDWTGPEGSDFVSPIWPDDYEDGDPPDGQKVTNEDLGKAASLL